MHGENLKLTFQNVWQFLNCGRINYIYDMVRQHYHIHILAAHRQLSPASLTFIMLTSTSWCHQQS